jgi:uncharacterized protein YlzI (FlbEa/FlbD family)
MDTLIEGKEYYVSSESLEKAINHKLDKNSAFKVTCTNSSFPIFRYKHFVDNLQFTFWVSADDENKTTIPGITLDLIPGKKYYVSNMSEKDAIDNKDSRIYFATIGGIKKFVSYDDELCYPNGLFNLTQWKYAVDPYACKKQTELTVDEIANLLRKNNLIEGELKIKE